MMDEQEDSSMMLSTTPGGGGAHHIMSQSHHRRRRPRPGSSPPPADGGLDDLLAFKKRQMLVAGCGGGGGSGGPHSSYPMHQAVPLVHTHTHNHHHRGGGACFFGAPAATTLLPAAAALPASMTGGGPFGRPSSPSCAAADLAAAASALSIMNGSGGSTPDDEPGGGSSSSCPLVPVAAPATAGSAGWGFGGNGGTAAAAAVQLLAVRCEWVPGPGSGKVHVVAPPAFLPAAGGRALSASAEIAALEESARLAHSFLRLWGPSAWAPLLTGKDSVVRFDHHHHHHQQQPSFLWSQQQQRPRWAEDGAGALPPAAAALGGANPGPQLSGLGAGVFLALVQLVSASVAGGGGGGGGGFAAPLRFRPRVAVLGELTLEGRVVLPASSSSVSSRDNTSEGGAHGGGGGGGDRLLAARVQAILGSGRADCVVLPREAAEGGGRAQLGFAAAAAAAAAASAAGTARRECAAASVRFAGDVRELVALAVEEGPGADAQSAWLPPPRGTGGGGGGGGRGGSGSNSSSSSGQARRLFVAPTLLPADGAVAAVAARCVEACALPRPLGGPPGRFIVTGLPHASAAAAGSLSVVGSGGGGDKGVRMPDGTKAQGGSSGSSNSNSSSARAALNTARFLLLKHQGDIARLLGPPSVDLRAMRLLSPDPAAASRSASGMEQEENGAAGVPVDVHLHLPHALPSPGYGLPALLALVAVAWPGARDSLEGIASLGEVNAVGALGLHARLRPTFVAALNGCGARKVVLPRAQARELVREEGGGVGDRWLLQSGVMVQGAERVLDAVRGVFLGDDGL